MISNQTRFRMCTAGLTLILAPLALANAPDKKFAQMDRDGDGKISRTEHSSGAQTMFSEMDTNRDAIVTAAEMDAKKEKKIESGEKPAPASSQSNNAMASREKIKAVDADGDGVLTAQEHAKGSEAMFDKMDTNRDGSLTREEMASGHKAMMKPHDGSS